MLRSYKVQNEENKILLFRDAHVSGKNKQKQGSDQDRCFSVGKEECWVGKGHVRKCLEY